MIVGGTHGRPAVAGIAAPRFPSHRREVLVNAPASAVRTAPRTGYRHEAFLFTGVDALVAGTVPFVRAGLDAGEPVMVALIDAHWQPLRAALGADADRVHHVDMGVLGRNPARIIPAWTAFVEEHRASGRPLRGIGEPIWAGRSDAELAECQIHEALLNLALDPRTPLWLMCPYDVDALGPDVVDEARRSHPEVCGRDPLPPTHHFGGEAHVRALWAGDLSPAPVTARSRTVTRGGLAAARAEVRHAATVAGLDAGRVDDLVLAVNELASNSLDHGGGRGVLRHWTQGATFLVEVEDAGHIDDLLVGRTSPCVDQPRGRGVWMVNQLCDLVQIRSSATGTVVRVHSRPASHRPVDRREPRGRRGRAVRPAARRLHRGAQRAREAGACRGRPRARRAGAGAAQADARGVGGRPAGPAAPRPGRGPPRPRRPAARGAGRPRR
jgi:anti-sigma regulatory factor (Ser/Thr protein kinase)